MSLGKSMKVWSLNIRILPISPWVQTDLIGNGSHDVSLLGSVVFSDLKAIALQMIVAEGLAFPPFAPRVLKTCLYGQTPLLAGSSEGVERVTYHKTNLSARLPNRQGRMRRPRCPCPFPLGTSATLSDNPRDRRSYPPQSLRKTPLPVFGSSPPRWETDIPRREP